MRVLIATGAWVLLSIPASMITGRALRGPEVPNTRSSVIFTPALAIAAACGATVLLIVFATVALSRGSAASDHAALPSRHSPEPSAPASSALPSPLVAPAPLTETRPASAIAPAAMVIDSPADARPAAPQGSSEVASTTDPASATTTITSTTTSTVLSTSAATASTGWSPSHGLRRHDVASSGGGRHG